MKKLSKHLIVLAIISFLVLPIFVTPVLASNTNAFGTGYVNNGLAGSLPSNQDPREVAVRIINFALTFLALIAVAVVMYGGFKWMTAAGNEDQVGEAKKLLGAGVIGLLIILAAWALTTFLIGQIINTVGNTV